MGLTLAIDLGSTYTKVVAVDLAMGDLVGVAQAESTTDYDINVGLQRALENLRIATGLETLDTDHILVCSSAAGGLRVVAIGLVRTLTTKAAEQAALGAGAKVIGAYSYGIRPSDVNEIEQIAPDLILLTGGTDGGNEEVLIRSAVLLSASRLNSPIIIAGNKMVSEQAQLTLEEAGKDVITVGNVLPELDKLNVEPARSAIRDIFMHRITHAKGLDKVKAIVGDIAMPTPMAVLRGASLLAEGAAGEEGLGELIVVDVGGATTDVHSVGHGYPSQGTTIVKGLPEPYLKRTVEGDLGIRYNALTILEKVGKEEMIKRMGCSPREFVDLEARIKYLPSHVGVVPENEEDCSLDLALANIATDIAMERHAGRIECVYLPKGKARVQYGKDLTKIKYVIGTGGVFAYGREPYRILQAVRYDQSNPESLRPTNPEFLLDKRYILYAAGLLAEVHPVEALKILKKHLGKASQ